MSASVLPLRRDAMPAVRHLRDRARRADRRRGAAGGDRRAATRAARSVRAGPEPAPHAAGVDGRRLGAHPFGTDQLGRDYLSRLIYGARISMMIGIFTVITSGLIGTTLGVLGGYFGGRIDDVVMFIITCRLAIPLILVALTVVALVGSSLTVVILTLGLLLWDRFAVVARATTMQVRNLDYVAAARAAGASRAHILLREVLPNILTLSSWWRRWRWRWRSCWRRHCPSSGSACRRRCRPGD